MNIVLLLLGSVSLCQAMLGKFQELPVVKEKWDLRTVLTNWHSTTPEGCAILCHRDPKCEMFRHANSTCTVPGYESPRVLLLLEANDIASERVSIYIGNDFAVTGKCAHFLFNVH